MDQTAVVLINLGTPDSPRVGDVRRYLSEFLNDGRVIDLPWLARKILVNLIIVPFRARKSAKLYQQLWTKQGSPLLIHALALTAKVQAELGQNFKLFTAMRYGQPSLKTVLHQLEGEAYKKIILVPLFPQYASATTGSIYEYALPIISRWNTVPELKMISSFHDHPAFVEAFAARAAEYHPTQWDHVIFSFHGLPLSQINRLHPEINCQTCSCQKETIPGRKLCYQAACYETARLIASRLGLSEEAFSVSFQSRLTKNWMSPFTDEMLIKKASEGQKKILILAPAFVADCLETNVEIGIEYVELFKEHGGEQLQMVASLNDHPAWVKGLSQLISQAD